jgi:hypothetical protein
MVSRRFTQSRHPLERATEDDLDSQVPNHTLLDMSVQRFYGPEILRTEIDQRGFCAVQRVGSLGSGIESDLFTQLRTTRAYRGVEI